jgi:GNAT superfamily N-acetyltransferase
MNDVRWAPITPEHAPYHRSLLDIAFEIPRGEASYLVDFPVWNPSIELQKNRFQVGAFRNGRLLSTASMRVAAYRHESGKEELFGLVGAVATHPDFKGQGLAGKALDFLLQQGRAAGAKSFALWGAEGRLYSSRGFRFGGVQLRSKIADVRLDGPLLEGFGIRTGWDEVIAEFLLKRKSGLRYRDADVLWLCRQTSVEWRTMWLENECVGYCGWNRGIDLPNIIHEIDGTAAAARSMIHFLKDRYPELELLHHPRHIGLGIHAIAPAEALAQFLFEDPESEAARNPEKLWFSGMDAC